MKFYSEFLVQLNKRVKMHFGFFFSVFHIEPKETNDLNVKNESKRITKNSKTNNKVFPNN